MESPVRIYLSAALVIHLVLLSSSNVQSSAIPPSTPQESKATTTNITPYEQLNSTTLKRKTRLQGNNIITKEDVSEESNDKFREVPVKIRGTVKYTKNTTTAPRRRSTTKKGDITIVTPEPKTKMIPDIIQSMRKYKYSVSSTSTEPYTEVGNEDEEEQESDIFKYPDFGDGHTNHDFGDHGFYPSYKSPFSDSSSSSNSIKSQNKNTFGSSFDNNFDDIILTTPKNDFFDNRFSEISQSIVENIDRHKTTVFKPEKNHAKRIEDVSVTKSLNVNDFLNNNRKPSNNSQLYFHKSKSIMVSDNDADGTSLSDVQGTSIYFEQSMLSTESYDANTDSDDDCDDDSTTQPVKVTTEHSAYDIRQTLKEFRNKKMKATLKPATPSVPKEVSTVAKADATNNPGRINVIHKRLKPSLKFDVNNMIKNNYNYSKLQETLSNKSDTKVDSLESRRKQFTRFNIVTSTSIIETTNNNSSSQSPTRLQMQRKPSNLTKIIDQSLGKSDQIINIFTDSPIISTFSSIKQNESTEFNIEATTENGILEQNTKKTIENFTSQNYTSKTSRRIQFTTPKSRITHRMSVKRNISESIQRQRKPSTVFTEHLNNSQQELPEKKTTLLTTVSSDIDPVFEPEISGAKKMVHSHTITDNNIPGLRKRGSAKYAGLSTSLPLALDGETVGLGSTIDLALPTASSSWGALAGMRNPPTLASSTTNVTAAKHLDDNELQRVADTSISDKTLGASATTNVVQRNASSEVTKPSEQGWTPVYVSISRNSSNNFKLNKSATAKPLETPKITNTFVTNELTENTQIESSTHTATTKAASGWIPVNNSVSNIENDSTNKIIQSGQPSTPRINTTMITFSVSSSNNKPELSSQPYSNVRKNAISTPSSISSLYATTKANNNKYNTNNDDLEVIPTTLFEQVVNVTSVPTIISQKPTPGSNISTKLNEIVDKTTPTNWHRATDPIITKNPVPTLITKGSAPTAVTRMTETFQAEGSTTITNLIEFTPSRSFDNTPVTTYRPVYNGNVETTIAQTEAVTYLSQPTTVINIDDVRSTTNANVGTEESTTTETEQTTEIFETPRTTDAETTETVLSSEELPATVSSEDSITNKTDFRRDTIIPTITTEESNTAAEEASTTIETTTITESVSVQQTTATNAEKIALTSDAVAVSEVTESVTTEYATTEAGTPRTESKLEDLTSNFAEDLTTHSPNSLPIESSSAAGVAIAVSTIGVIALLLLIGLLLVLRRRRARGRRCGVYAQRCTPVSLDTYSLDSVDVRRKGARLRASKRSYGNPAFDDEVVISHPMQYPALASFALNGESMASEFSEIPSGSVRADEVPPGCADKNRYSNILPLPETRVPLQMLDGDETSQYINANYVTGPGNIKNYYIACQAPLANTVNDFWRMIWEQNSRLIVMLTEYMENGSMLCYEYLPPSEVTDNKRSFGDLQVVLKRREQYDKYAISYIQLKSLASGAWREVAHLWYFWPPKGVPDDYESVINFMSEMRSHMKIAQNAKEFDENDAVIVENGSANAEGSPGSERGLHVYSPQKAEELMKKGALNGSNTLARMKAAAEQDGKGVRPCVVVCASGAGRTGAVVALDLCARALESSGTVDVPRTVRALRAARPHAVQNKSQYIFLYKVLSEYGHKLNGGVDSI